MMYTACIFTGNADFDRVLLILLGNPNFFGAFLACVLDNTIPGMYTLHQFRRERSGSVVECLTRDRRAAGSSLTGVTALWSLSKTHLS